MALVAVEPPAPPAPTAPRLPTVEIVVPTHNEAHVLDASVTRLSRFLNDHFPLPWRITIADNGSTDGTSVVARRLARTMPSVAVLVLPTRRARRCAADGVDAQPGRHRRLHRRRPVDRPRRPAAARRAADLRAQRRRRRLPTRVGRPHQPRRQAGGHLPRLQPPPPAHAAHPGARRPVRLQGDARGGRPRAAARRSRRRVVLRHRAVDPGQARRATGCSRCRSTGSTTTTRG